MLIDGNGRKALVLFFDGVTTVVQILIFFILGYIAHPTNLPHVLLPAIIIFLFISFVARPVAVSSILAPFRKYPARQIGLVSYKFWQGNPEIFSFGEELPIPFVGYVNDF